MTLSITIIKRNINEVIKSKNKKPKRNKIYILFMMIEILKI